jgi:hypothetical protein
MRTEIAVGPRAFVDTLRDEVETAGAQELLLVIAPGGFDQIVEDFSTIGTFLAPAIRCAAHQLDFVVADAWSWLTELTHLHEVPE